MARPAATSSRKQTTTTTHPATDKRAKSKRPQSDDDQDQVDEEPEVDDEEEPEDVALDEDSVVAETQFEHAERKPSSSKAKKPTTATRKPVPTAGTKRKAKDELSRPSHLDADDAPQPTARERKLEAQFQAKRKALDEVSAAYAKLRDLRETRAEQAEATLKELAREQQVAFATTIAAYKKESDNLKFENAELQDAAYASPRTKAARATNQRVQELETQHADALARIEELERQVEETEEAWRNKLDAELAERERAWNAEREELVDNLETAQNDYKFEAEQSKKLQAQVRSLGSTSSSSSLGHTTGSKPATTSSATTAKLEQVEAERDLLNLKIQFSEDITGLTVHSMRVVEDDPLYVCSLVDCYGTEQKSLQFKLSFSSDKYCYYEPDLEPERDSLLCQTLPAEFQQSSRLPDVDCAAWFSRLASAMNQR
ncbi:uncharacterized protein JCM15063_000717 [Sporobolomyces koalae]|uniref:uncharacterized protein n=1 Tax=Sporobolomyces koalae TaxID=500713 RepID=UPI00316D2B8C